MARRVKLMIRSMNPATGEVWKEFQQDDAAAVERKLERAIEAFAAHKRTSFERRAECLRNAEQILLRERQEIGRLATMEMGKPLKAAIQEVEKCAAACAFYAENGERFLAAELIEIPDGAARVEYQPLGVVLAIMPWNFPFWQVFRFAVPALMAGNAGLLKHASNVPQCAEIIESVLSRAGFSEGAFQTLMIPGASAEALIADSRIAAVTLTGSVEAGRKVASAAGRALKKTVLELGGSDPFIVMPSAEINHAAAMAAKARCVNNGQSCIAAKRFIVHGDVYEAFRAAFVREMSNLKVSDPMDLATDVGPLATEDVLLSLEKQVNETVAAGARVLAGGHRLPGPGYFFEPTVLEDVSATSPAAREEMFGPVAAMFLASDLDEALRIANNTQFGLGASIWTSECSEQEAFAREVAAGVAFINGMVASDPRLPFGGIRDSGFGRELGVHGIREFVNVKTIVKKSLGLS